MIRKIGENAPQCQNAAFVAESAAVLGDVTLESGSSVWYSAVVRGDLAAITVGENSNIQDNATLHSDVGYPITVGRGVSIGHNAVVHGAIIGDDTLVGMNSVILNGAVIGRGCIIGAGAVVSAGSHFPDGSLIVGTPAQAVAEVHPVQQAKNRENAADYCRLAALHAKAQG